MKKSKKTKGVVKGAPSGFVISLLIHATAFLLAGMLVVFNVVKKEEKKFVPPKAVERPKMKLKKPKVKIKKTAKPKPTTRIVTKVKRSNMPQLQLPEMSGMSDGLGGGIGGFELMPDLSDMASPFGSTITTGSDLTGYFYNFNRNRSGSKIPMSPEQLTDLVHKFMKGGWKASKLAPYYRSPKPLYATTICVPTVMSELAPEAFGEGKAEGYCWAVLYKGDLVYPEDIRFRFWGVGDKFIAVNVDGETVLFSAYRSSTREEFGDVWQSKDSKDWTYFYGESRARPSDWITLKAGEPKPIQVLMGDLDGGLVYHMLSVEVEGVDYPWTRAGGGPTFPAFRTGEIPRDAQDQIYANLYPGDTSLTNGPIFRDYFKKTDSSTNAVVAVEPVEEPAPMLESDEGLRLWTSLDGKSTEARFKTVVGNNVILETAKKKQLKLPLDQLSPEDRDYIVLSSPPSLAINFTKNSSQILPPSAPPWSSTATQRPLQMFNYQFGVSLKAGSAAKDYHYPLSIEYFAIGEEIDGDNYVLLDRKEDSFVPSELPKRMFEFGGDDVELRRMAYRDSAPMRGTKYGGFLVVVRDKTGKIIDYKASHEFLYENLVELEKRMPNNHFDKNCQRTIPAQPNEDSRGNGALEG